MKNVMNSNSFFDWPQEPVDNKRLMIMQPKSLEVIENGKSVFSREA